MRTPRIAKSARLFNNAWGGPMDLHNWSNRTWRQAREAVGVTAAPSDGRHTFASLLIHEGRDVVEVQHQLGHASATTTLDHYAHLFTEGRLAARVSMEDAINQARLQVFGASPEGGLRVIEGGEG